MLGRRQKQRPRRAIDPRPLRNLTHERVFMLLTLGGNTAQQLEDDGVVKRHFSLLSAPKSAVHTRVDTAA